MARKPAGKIITFYSYKGGTGRSMVLANIAWILASNGKRVLTIDWDLEAPGLHRYFDPFLIDRDLTSSDGVIDFVINYAIQATSLSKPTKQSQKELYKAHANILRYAVSLKWEFPKGGKLDFVPAGRQGPSYSTRVNQFDWQDFYDRLGGGVFLETVKEKVRKSYDYILIDSRTGVSDTSGICTIQMPDILVVCFTLNNQSIEGASAVASSVYEKRRESGIKIFPVAMRIENAEKDKLETRRNIANKKFIQFPPHIEGRNLEKYRIEVQFPYIPYYAYEEVLATFLDKPGEPNSLLAPAERLTSYITEGSVRHLDPPSERERQNMLARYEGKVGLTEYDQYDLFLSHSKADEEWTELLLTRLEQEEWQGRKLKIFFAPWDIRPGQSVPQRLEHALSNSRKIGLIISPESISSNWPELEQLVATSVAATERQDRLIPIYRRASEIPDILKPILSIDFTDGSKFEESYRVLLATIKNEPLPRATRADLKTVAKRNRGTQSLIVISGTARDLPEHRKEVVDACLRQGTEPKMMEHLPAADADAIAESLRIVDEADIYLGVFAHRYGYVPKGHDISITEMEYNRAVELGIPCLIFVMDDAHPISFNDVELGEGAMKLKRFKERLRKENIVNFFNSPSDLRVQVIDSLSRHRTPDLTAFHYLSDIPVPPDAFIVHPYTFLQTRDLIGRQQELNLLADWVAQPQSAAYQARIFNVVAIGGMGKSALTWKWFNDIAPNEMKPLAGRMWWSFYESDATFENFIIRALAYVTGRAREDIEKNTKPSEREDQLLTALDREPFLLALDGLERILVAYARMDANRLADDDLDQQTANAVAGAVGLPKSAAQSFIGQHLLRKTADPRAGNFLRKLSRVRASRVLVSTRLYPADLQTGTGDPIPGTFAYFLRGLSDDDALNLWRAFGVSGSRDELVRLFQTFDKHPLLIHALASKIATYRPAPRDYDRWRKDNPDFDPFSLPIEQRKLHVLAFALRDLDESAKKALDTIAAFRMPASYETLMTVLVDEGKTLPDENALDSTLTELEDRGLLGWDKRSNRYDLHPIVRGVVWGGLTNDMRRDVYTTLHTHFEALPKIENYLKVENLEDLTPAIELYNTLIGLVRYDDATRVFREYLQDALLYRLSAIRQSIELLEMLFPDGLEQLTPWIRQAWLVDALNALALSYHFSGQPARAVTLYHRQVALGEGDLERLCTGLINLTSSLRATGALAESQFDVLQSIVAERKISNVHAEAISICELGLTLATRGLVKEAGVAFHRALRILSVFKHMQQEGMINAYMAQLGLWNVDYETAFLLANQAWKLANVQRYERDFIRAARLQGAVALGLNDLARADERLRHSLARARAVNYVEEELPALIELAELGRRRGDLEAARELLDDVWASAERGAYPLHHADALNVLAQIERDVGNIGAAIEAATNAYRKAWCDGPPFAYHWGLEAARAHLKALDAPEPTDLPPFDSSKYGPRPEVDIGLKDEYTV